MDLAKITLSDRFSGLYVYQQFVECQGCPLMRLGNTFDNSSFILKTYFENEFAISKLNRPYLLESDHHEECLNICDSDCKVTVLSFFDQDEYNVTIHPNLTCSFERIVVGRSNLLEALLTTSIYAVLFFVLFAKLRSMCSVYSPLSNDEQQQQQPTDIQEHSRTSRPRFRTLDIFRGLTIFSMVFVNYGAGEFQQLKHAPWNGLNFADVIFPFFIFIMGVSVSIALASAHVETLASLGRHLRHVGIRSLKLFLLGIVVNSCGTADFATIRIPGVLQRFALCYGVVASTHLLSKYLRYHCRYAPFVKMFTIVPLIVDYFLALTMLLVYSIVSFVWRYDPSCPTGYLGPGGLGDGMQFINCTGGSAHRLDDSLFGRSHSYPRFFGAQLYDPGMEFGIWHDPEGALGTSSSIILTIIGFQFGQILVGSTDGDAGERRGCSKLFQRLKCLSLFGGCLIGFVGTRFGLGIPINKQLWSLSFVFATGALAIFVFAALYRFINESPNCSASRLTRESFFTWPFECAGKNAILLYVGHEVVKKMFPFTYAVDTQLAVTYGHLHFLLRNLLGATIWLLIAVYLDLNRLYFKV